MTRFLRLNQWRQPTPGERLAVHLASVAQRGCTLRSLTNGANYELADNPPC